MEKFIEDIRQKYNIGQEGVEILYESLRTVSFRKGDIIVAEGRVDDSIYLLRKGVWRTYAIKNAEEITLWFATAGDFDLAPWCVMKGQPSRYTISSSSNSEAIEITKSTVMQLSQVSPSFVGFLCDLYADIFLHTDDILVDMASPRALNRYIAFMEKMPEIFREVSQKEIARFLGITPQSLSRIRAGII